jgi:hypothetical protein
MTVAIKPEGDFGNGGLFFDSSHEAHFAVAAGAHHIDAECAAKQLAPRNALALACRPGRNHGKGALGLFEWRLGLAFTPPLRPCTFMAFKTSL